MAFEDLVARYPRARGVHFAYGLVLSREGSPAALPMLRREVDLFPDHGEAQLEIAFELPRARRPRTGAGSGPQRRPGCCRSRSGATWRSAGPCSRPAPLEEAVAELERARVLEPDARDVYVALAQAYARAGRTDDVERRGPGCSSSTPPAAGSLTQ